jgi:hypothetical protein
MCPPISKLANSSYATGDPNFGMDRILGQLQIKLQFVSGGVFQKHENTESRFTVTAYRTYAQTETTLLTPAMIRPPSIAPTRKAKSAVNERAMDSPDTTRRNRKLTASTRPVTAVIPSRA